MKRLMIISFLGLTAFTTTLAQSGTGFAVKAGLNGNIQLSLLGEDQSLLAMHGGASVNFSLSRSLKFQPEILISQKGEKWDEDFMKGKYLLTYLDVPLLLLFYPAPNNPFFNLQAGPQLGYLLRAMDVYENEMEGDKGKRDIKERYKNLDLGLAIGIEFNFKFRGNITLRYTHGLTIVSDFHGTEFKNYVLQLSAGYRIVGK